MPAIQGNRSIAHITPMQCKTPADAAAAALSVRERRRSFFFVAEPPRIAEVPQPVKAEEPKVVPPAPAVPTLPDSIYPAYAGPHCLKADTVNGSITAPETMTQTRYSIEDVQRAMCLVSGTRKNEMLSPRRTKVVTEPRQIAMLLCKMLTARSLPYLGLRFAGRDHTTVLHAIRKYEWMIDLIKASVPEGSSASTYASAAWNLYRSGKPA